MAKAPGDDRTGELDDIPFDPNSYPNKHFVPTELPPPPPNVLGGIPYRGQEQHGVPFDTVPAEYGTLANEQRALDAYNSDITPRDLTNVKPVKVSIVNEPDLIHELRSRQTSFSLQGKESGYILQLAQYQQLRTKLRVTVEIFGGGADIRNSADWWTKCWLEGFISSQPQPTSLDGIAFSCSSDQKSTLLFETESHDPFYLSIANILSAQPMYVTVWSEYWHYDGEQLL